MLSKIILLSGPICSGKTTLLAQLEKVFECHVFKTSKALKKRRNTPHATRSVLQKYGENLDQKYRCRWIIGYLEEFITNLPIDKDSIVVVDSVRAKGQIDLIRSAYGPLVFHFHLTAPRSILEKRYKNLIKRSPEYEFSSFEESQKNRTERNIDKLAQFADVVHKHKSMHYG